MYQQHPSSALTRVFRERPFQGVDPNGARFIFLGLDANYSADIEQQTIFPQLLEYHRDGASFWRKYGVHHPFLLPSYRGDGRRYHVNFARIGLTPAHAADVSFVELLHVPTVGRSLLARTDFDPAHLKWIGSLLSSGVERDVFLSAGVLRLLQTVNEFAWIKRSSPCSGPLAVIQSVGGTRLYRHLHFSNYGKFQKQMDAEAAAIRQIVQG